jgi:hypothetical protein
VQALQGAGAAAVLGGLPGVGQQGTNQDLQLAAQLDQAKYERDTFVAQQEQAMQARKVSQQNDFLSTQLQGAQMARAQGQANINAGLTGAAGTIGALAVQYEKGKPLYDKQETEQTKTEQPGFKPTEYWNQNPTWDEFGKLPENNIYNPTMYQNKANPLSSFQYNLNIGQSQGPYYKPGYSIFEKNILSPFSTQ